jgi:aspartate 1-decarboxylase
MHLTLLKSKIHRAAVTGASLHYEGSLTIAVDLAEKVGLLPYEKILIGNMANGARFETYAIPGGPGTVCLNGAAARLVQPGDRIIVITYADYDEAELEDYTPRVVHVDGTNRIIDEFEAVTIAAEESPVRFRA